MMGHLKERSAGNWSIVLYVRDPATGKSKHKWFSFRGSRREAERQRARLVAGMPDNKIPADTNGVSWLDITSGFMGIYGLKHGDKFEWIGQSINMLRRLRSHKHHMYDKVLFLPCAEEDLSVEGGGGKRPRHNPPRPNSPH